MIPRRVFRGKPAVSVCGESMALPAKHTWWRPGLGYLEILTVTSIIGVLLGLTLSSGNMDRTHRFPPPGPGAVKAFADVAGEYHQGARLGQSWALSILPDGRYSFIWSGCCGVYDREMGTVQRINENLVLSPIKSIESRMERAFLSIKWGGRSYLIPPEKLLEFCDAIIQGDEPRDRLAGHYYLLGLDERVTGIPELPERWDNYLRDNLLMGTIVEGTERGRAKADIGAQNGVEVGSILSVLGHTHPTRKLKAVVVSDHSCELEDVDPHAFKKPVESGCGVVMVREEDARENP